MNTFDKMRIICVGVLLLIFQSRLEAVDVTGKPLSEEEIQHQINEYSVEISKLCRLKAIAEWNVGNDIGNMTKELYLQNISSAFAAFEKENWKEKWQHADQNNYKNETIRRQLFYLKQISIMALPDDDYKNFMNTSLNIFKIFQTARVCPYENQNCNKSIDGMSLNGEIDDRFAHSRNFDELKYLWSEWHKNSGQLMRNDYKKLMNYINETAKLTGFADASKMDQALFEDDQLLDTIDTLWNELKPFYTELHTYMKYKLIEIYDNKINRSDPNIPAHLLGNMYAESWLNLYNETRPFKNVTSFDITPNLIAKGIKPYDMFNITNEFYTSMGLLSNEISYTKNAIIEKPKNDNIDCHASSRDFCDGKDFRIRMCTKITMQDLITIHHEMGHIQYSMQYKHLPYALRRGANPGFHEAIGDTIALSASTPTHLIKIGLLENYEDSNEENINSLFWTALDRVAFLPFGMIIDKWRYDVLSNKIPESQWNAHWWKLREKYQQISAPIPRSEDDFDPGAKYHIAINLPFFPYFIANILQFQIYRALCIEAKQYNPNDKTGKPLHKCDFYQSTEAGKRLADGLKLGASEHWTNVLKSMTNESALSARAMVEYFNPLHVFLAEENKRLANEDSFRQLLEDYNKNATIECRKLRLSEWDKITDLNNRTKNDAYEEAIKENAKFIKEKYQIYFDGLKPTNFTDEKLKRQIMYLTKLEVYALKEDRLEERTKTINEMEKIYNNAAFCDWHEQNNCTTKLTLDPEIMNIMATSKSFDQLKYTWAMWHNSTGPLMRPFYKKYIEISNEAAKLNEFNDYGDMWRSKYEDPNFIENVKELWHQIEPLYDALHEYTRNKLIEIYGDKINKSDPLIPAHLLGNMWGQTWINLYERIKPYNESSDIDITKSLQKKHYTPLKIFQESDKFYKSLGLESNEMSYTGNSIIEKPKDRLIVCHASAWDLCDGKDFRIKQCASVDRRNFITAHHEMGHIQYYILYKDQPLTLRDGANPGFHEAIGDLIALSASTPTHLKKVGLLDDYRDTEEDNINALFHMALERVAFLPFGLLIDLYRYDLFSGNVSENNWNKHWEELREKYQKIRSPVERNETHFDAGAKFHVASDYQYMAYFISHNLEFQLLKSLCLAAGQYDPKNASKPLHKCDIEGSLQAGKRLRAGLSLGLSKHWSETLRIMTDGETKISAEALLEYFEPLHKFLIKENDKNRPLNATHYMLIAICVVVILAVVGGSYGIYRYNQK